MSARFVTGFPRAGKGVFSAALLWKALTNTRRCIVTTLAINLDKLQEACDAHYPDRHINVASRVKKLSKGETRRFWRHRACKVTRDIAADLDIRCEWLVVPGAEFEFKATKRGDEDNPLLESDDTGRLGLAREAAIPHDADGVLYIIDEVHLHFSVARWREMGDEAMWYLSQHGHWGDDLILITQRPAQCHSALVGLAEEFTQITNYGKRTFRGMAAGAWFKCLSWWGEPTRGQPADNVTAFKLPDIIKKDGWYSSKGGVGIETVAGGSPDAEHQRKGISPLIWAPVLVLLAVGVLIGVRHVPQLVMGKIMRAGMVPVQAALHPVVLPVATNVAVIEAQASLDALERRRVAAEPPYVVARSWGQTGKLAVVTLTNGVVVFGEHLTIGAVGVVMDGQLYHYR